MSKRKLPPSFPHSFVSNSSISKAHKASLVARPSSHRQLVLQTHHLFFLFFFSSPSHASRRRSSSSYIGEPMACYRVEETVDIGDSRFSRGGPKVDSGGRQPRLPPVRGRIKRQIFSSLFRTVRKGVAVSGKVVGLALRWAACGAPPRADRAANPRPADVAPQHE